MLGIVGFSKTIVYWVRYLNQLEVQGKRSVYLSLIDNETDHRDGHTTGNRSETYADLLWTGIVIDC